MNAVIIGQTIEKWEIADFSITKKRTKTKQKNVIKPKTFARRRSSSLMTVIQLITC